MTIKSSTTTAATIYVLVFIIMLACFGCLVGIKTLAHDEPEKTNLEKRWGYNYNIELNDAAEYDFSCFNIKGPGVWYARCENKEMVCVTTTYGISCLPRASLSP